MPVFGYEEYYDISNCGDIYSKRTNKLLKQFTNKKGYKTIGLFDGGTIKTHYSHRLVLISFIGVNLKKPQVNHKNGFKHDNNIENLEWCTAKENIIHAVETGLNNNNGERSSSCKLSDKDIIKIKKLCCKGFLSQAYIAKKFNVSQSLICKINKNKHRSI